MADNQTQSQIFSYRAPLFFIILYYLVLAAWVLFCLTYLETILKRMELSLIFGIVMIIFVVLITCYFSLGISHRIEVTEDGQIRLISARRVIDTLAEEIHFIEGPHIPIGFLRFRLEAEKAYLFYLAGSEAMKEVLLQIRKANPDIDFKHLKDIR